MDLYNHIYENTKHNIMELNDDEKQTIIDLIPKLDQKGHDLLYFLIHEEKV